MPCPYKTDISMDEEAIEKELEWFPREWAIAFAARCAAQCLPALLEKKDPTDNWFAYWPNKERDQHLFAVLRANSVAFFVATLTTYTDAAVYASENADDAAHAIYNPDIIYAAAYVSYAAYTAALCAANVSTSTYASYAAYATYEASAYTAGETGIDIAQQLTLLSTDSISQDSPAVYLFQPLWQPGDEWYERGRDFVRVLRDFGSGFDLWADWYEDRLEGRPPDMNLLKAIATLSKEQLAQEPAQINAYLKSLVRTKKTWPKAA